MQSFATTFSGSGGCGKKGMATVYFSSHQAQELAYNRPIISVEKCTLVFFYRLFKQIYMFEKQAGYM
jgi:hypothetical protein